MDVDAVADIEIRRETQPLKTPSFKIALALALIVYFITRSMMKTLMIVFSEIALKIFIK